MNLKLKFSILLITTTTFFHLTIVSAQKVSVNVSESSIHWIGKKITGQHDGVINLLSGNLIMDSGLLTGGNFVVDMNSIKAKDLKGEDARKLEKSLKSNEWFNVAKYPEAKLVLTSVENLGEGFYNVKGDFTIKGKTNPTSFKFQLNDLQAKTKLIIDRRSYNILSGSNSIIVNIKDKVINNEFEIEVHLKL